MMNGVKRTRTLTVSIAAVIGLASCGNDTVVDAVNSPNPCEQATEAANHAQNVANSAAADALGAPVDQRADADRAAAVAFDVAARSADAASAAC